MTAVAVAADNRIVHSVSFEDVGLPSNIQVDEPSLRDYGYGYGRYHEGSYVDILRHDAGNDDSQWIPGKVIQAHEDGRYDVLYDDVALGQARHIICDQLMHRDLPPICYHVGDIIKGNYKRAGKWYPGKIVVARVDEAGTSRYPTYLYHIIYEDGEEEIDVPSDFIRYRQDSDPQAIVETVLRVGDRVQANYKGHGRWYKGTIVRKRSDGTYDISYDDKGNETFVPGSYIKFIQLDSSTEPVTPENQTREMQSQLSSQ